MENTVLQNSSGTAADTPELMNDSHMLSHKPLRAEVADLEQAADVIRKRMEPKPPNIVQKSLRASAIPLGLAAAYGWARTHAMEGFLKFMEKKGAFEDPLLFIPEADSIPPRRSGMSDAQKYGSYLKEHEPIKRDRVNNTLKMAPNREKVTWKVKWPDEKDAGRTIPPEKQVEFAKEVEAARQATLDAMAAEKSLPLLEKLKLAAQREVELFKFTSKDHSRASGIVFQSLFAGGAALGLALTVSDNKNFLSFLRKDKKHKHGAPEQKHMTWEARHDAEASAANAPKGIA